MTRTKWSRDKQPSKTAKYDEGNERSARIILADPAKYGEFSVRWAKAFRRRRAEELPEPGLTT